MKLPTALKTFTTGSSRIFECRRSSFTAHGIRELNRAKAYSRVGMGRCQGRLCGAAAAEVVAATMGCDIAAVGRLRGQPPVKPLPAGQL